MPLTISPANPTDLTRILEIQHLVFSGKAFGTVLFPDGYTPSGIATAKTLALSQMTTDASIRRLKVTDSEIDDEIVGAAQWNIYQETRPDDEWKKGVKIECEDENIREMSMKFMGAIEERRRKWIGGEAHCLLYILCTDPAHQRRGAGKMLVQWGCEEADKLGLPAYVEASAAGHRLYESCGFEDREKVVMGKDLIGEYGPFQYTFMQRPAKGL
ncbi:MAG: hypothetical protein M1836_000708 [Candelina mexicana]|nr:MAG: hypothetical protein M1836_000708 [Candelina mexicana]